MVETCPRHFEALDKDLDPVLNGKKGLSEPKPSLLMGEALPGTSSGFTSRAELDMLDMWNMLDMWRGSQNMYHLCVIQCDSVWCRGDSLFIVQWFSSLHSFPCFILFPFLSIGAKVQCVGFASVASALHRSFAPDAKPGYVDRFHQGLQCGTSCDLSTLVQHIATQSWIFLNHVFWISICIHLPIIIFCVMPRLRHRMTGFGTVQAPGSRRSRENRTIFGDLFIVCCHKYFFANLKDPIWSTDMWFEGVIVHESIGN